MENNEVIQNNFAAGAVNKAADTSGITDAVKAMQSVLQLDTVGPINGYMSSEQVVKFTEKLDEVFKNTNSPDLKFRVVRIDKDQYGTYCSALVLTAISTQTPQIGVICYTMMLESTADQLPPIRETHGNTTVVRPVVVSDAYDAEFRKVQTKAINETLGLQASNEPQMAGVVVVPRGFNTEDKEAFSMLVRNAGFAITTEIYRKRKGPALVLGQANPNSYMQITASYGNKPVIDAVGLPQRSDVVLNFTENQTRRDNQSLNNRNSQSSRFGTISGYVDLFWNPTVNQQQMGNAFGYQFQQPMVTAHYSPVFVIRSLKNERAGALEGQLALLLASAAMIENNEWVNTFQSRWINSRRDENRDRVFLGDVGALNIEANLPINGQMPTTQYGKPINTREDSFDQAKFMALMSATVRPELYFALDMPILGAESWYMDPFLLSTTNTSDSEGHDQTKEISDALDRLTSGNFTKRFRELGGTTLWLTEPMPFHMGYYRDQQGNMRDLADVDLLAVLNTQGESDPAIGQKWAATWVPRYENVNIQLSKRMDIINAILGPGNVVQTGWGQRCYLNPLVIQALSLAAGDVRFNMNFVSPYSNQGMMNGRAMFDFASTVHGLRSGQIGNAFHAQAFNPGFNANTPMMNGFGFNQSYMVNR